MGRNLALIEDDALIGVDPGGEIGGRDLAGVVGELGRILPHGNGVEIDDAIDAVVVLLERDEIPYRAQIVPQVQIAGGLNARKNAPHRRLPVSLAIGPATGLAGFPVTGRPRGVIAAPPRAGQGRPQVLSPRPSVALGARPDFVDTYGSEQQRAPRHRATRPPPDEQHESGYA